MMRVKLYAFSSVRLLFFASFFVLGFSALGLADPVALPPQGPSDVSAVPESQSISLDFKEADITTVLRVMSLKTNVNIVAGPEVKGTVTIRLENVPWEKALQMVLKTYGYVYERDGNIIRITTRENLAAEPLVTQTFVLNYSKAGEIQSAVQDILTERGRIKVSDRTNTLIVTDISTNIYSIGEVIKKIDMPTQAAFIDSKIVNTQVGISENLGIEWNTGGTTSPLTLTGSSRPVTFPFAQRGSDNDTMNDQTEQIPALLKQFFPITSAASEVNRTDNKSFPTSAISVSNNAFSYGTLSLTGFQMAVQFLKARSNTKIVSNPRIVVLNHQKASIHVGDNIPLPTFDTSSGTGRLVVSGFNYDKLKTGVTMEVTPHINDNMEILVEVKPAVNAQGNTISFNADLSAPIINETTAETQVLIESGQTIAIGGLLTDNTQTSEKKVPYISDVPVIGKLFRSKRQTAGSANSKVETLFFITVTIVDSEGQPITKGTDQSKRGAPDSEQNTIAPSAPEETEPAKSSDEKDDSSAESHAVEEKHEDEVPAAAVEKVEAPVAESSPVAAEDKAAV